MAAYGNRARLGIPQVNQRPRVKSGVTPLKAAIGNRVRVGGRVGLSNRFAVSTPPTAPSDPFQTASSALPKSPTPLTKPVGPLGTGGGLKTKPSPQSSGMTFTEPTLAPGQADPRDATYWANLAKLKFTDEQEYAKDLREQTMADTNYSYALQQAIQGRARQERNLGLETIKSGLTDSGYHDRTDREQTQTYTEERAHAQITKEQEDQARAAARKALEEGYTVEGAALLAEASARYAQQQREEAANGAGEPSPGAPPPPGAGAGQAGYTGTGPAAGPFWGPKGPGGYGYGKGNGNGGTTAPASAGPAKKQAIAQKRRKAR